MVLHGVRRVGLMLTGMLAFCWLAFAGTAAALPAGCTQGGPTATCTYAAQGETAFIVPTGVTSISATAVGAQGRSDFFNTGSGGLGAQATAMIAVTPGETLYLQVNVLGGRGGSTSRPTQLGGNGGGESDVRTCPAVGTCAGTTLASRLLVAGGGGGVGSFGPNGGNAGTPSPAGDGGSPASGFDAGGGTGATATAAGTGGGGVEGHSPEVTAIPRAGPAALVQTRGWISARVAAGAARDGSAAGVVGAEVSIGITAAAAGAAPATQTHRSRVRRFRRPPRARRRRSGSPSRRRR